MFTKLMRYLSNSRVFLISKLVDARELKDVKMITGEIALAVAVFFGHTRLIDNITITVK